MNIIELSLKYVVLYNYFFIVDKPKVRIILYRRAIGDGAIVQELGRDNQAIAEMNALLKEIAT